MDVAKIRVTAEGDTAKAKSEIDKLNKSVNDSDKSTKAFGASFGTMVGGLMSAIGGITAVSVAVNKIFDFGEQGAVIVQTEDKFDRLSESIGTTAEALSEDLHDATNGMMSDAELMAGATNLMALGLVKTHDEAVRMTRVVGVLGMDMNQLVLTLTNQTTMRFDALGVSVAGFDERVKKLKETGLDTNEAFTEAFLQQAEAQIGKVGDVADSAVAPFKRMQASMKNLGDTVKKDLSPYLANAADALNYILTWNEKITEAETEASERVARSAATWGDYTIALFETKEAAYGLTNYEEKLLEAMREGTVVAGDAATMNEDQARAIAHVWAKMEGLTEAEYELIRAQELVSTSNEPLLSFYEMYAPVVQEAASATEDMNAAAAENAARMEAQAEAINAVTDALYKGGDASDEYANRMKAAQYNIAVNREELENMALVVDTLFAGGLISEEDIISANALIGIEAARQEVEGGIISITDANKELQENFGLTWEQAQAYITGAKDPLEEMSDILNGLDPTKLDDLNYSAEELATAFNLPLEVAQDILDMLDKLNGKTVTANINIRTRGAVSIGTGGGQTGFYEQATGSSGVVSSPTLFLAGEAGVPEQYSFNPIGAGGMSAGGGLDTERIIQELRMMAGQIGSEVANALIVAEGR